MLRKLQLATKAIASLGSAGWLLFLPGLLVSCGDAVGPDRSGSVWQGITDQGVHAQPRSYGFDAAPLSLATLEVTSEGGIVVAEVDDRQGKSLGSATLNGPQPDTIAALVQFDSACGCTLTVSVRPSVGQADTTVRYTVRLTPVDTLPERHAEKIRLGDVVSDETLGPSFDVDVFTLAAQAGQDAVLRLQQPTATPGVEALFYAQSSGQPLGIVAGSGWQRFSFPATGSYSIRVGYQGAYLLTPGVVVPYRLETYFVDRAPERASAALPTDTVVAESLDRPGDIDEFHFTAAAGEVFTVDLAVPPSQAGGDVSATVSFPGRPPMSTLAATPTATAGAGSWSDYLVAPFAGEYTVSVQGSAAQVGDSLGYTLQLHRVNPAPEGGRTLLVPGDSLLGETLQAPSDIDTFTFRVPADSNLEALLVHTDSADRPIDCALKDPSGADVRLLHGPLPGQCLLQLSALAPGDYELAVRSVTPDPSSAPRFSGGYTIVTTATKRAPEDAPATIRVGDTITESISLYGDVDTFTLDPAGHRYISLAVERSGPAGGDDMLIRVSRDGVGDVGALEVPVPTLPGVPTVEPRITLPDTGSWTLTVQVSGDSARLDYGSYKLSVLPVATTPEHASPDLTAGQSAHELLDYLGDLDFFTLRGTPGDTVVVGVQADNGTSLRIDVLAPGADSALASADTYATSLVAAQPLVLGPTGTLSLQAGETCYAYPFCTYSQLGGYTVRTWVYSTAPEHAAPDLAPGDSAVEAVDYPYDVDDFQISGAAGDTLSIDVARPADVPVGTPLQAVVLGPDGAQVSPGLYYGFCCGNEPTPGAPPVPWFRLPLPATGSYTLRVWAGNAVAYGLAGYSLYRR